MFCRNCGYQNPERNGFCGMCGNKLAPVDEKVPITLERAAPQASSAVAKVVSPADTPRQPAAPVAEAARSDKWWVEDKDDKEEKKEKEERENETTISGPSFLGLSSTGSGEAGGYSYLLEEEEQPSHARVWVLLLLLLVLGGVLYVKWQPIRDYVLTMAPSRSRPQPQPAQDAKNYPPSASAASAPPTTPAENDAAPQPATATESKPEQNQVAQPGQELPHAGQQSSSADKPDESPKTTPARASMEPAAEPASKPSGTKAVSDKKPAAAAMTPAPPGNPGSELVSSGERYLYARGVARNCDQAITYFNAAAAKQNPQAFSHLGALFATGQCVPLDRPVAYAWFRRAYAKEPGNRYFEQNLTMLWRQMTPAERQRATGRQ